MALTGDEQRLIGSANMHLPGPPGRPRAASAATCGACASGSAQRAGARERRSGRAGCPARSVSAREHDTASTSSTERAPSPRARARAAARAYLKGIGFDDEALAKPIIGVANTWIETMPCNFHLRALAAKVKEGIRAAGGTPMEFNTIAISDGITMGTRA